MSSQKYRKFGYIMSEIRKLTEDELNCLEEIQFFKRKKIVTDHISNLFAELNAAVITVNQEYINSLPKEVILSSGKISKGENYNGFPWIVLDAPRVFQKEDVFAFRSMLWWGHEISFTLHLSGRFLKEIKDLPLRLVGLVNKDYFICVNDTPWQYHFKPENYLPLTESSIKENLKNDFLKISFKEPVSSAEEIPVTGIRIYKEVINALYC